MKVPGPAFFAALFFSQRWKCPKIKSPNQSVRLTSTSNAHVAFAGTASANKQHKAEALRWLFVVLSGIWSLVQSGIG